MRRAVIITALDVEYNAVRAYLKSITEEVHRDSIYEKGIFETEQGRENWEIVLASIGMGNTNAALESEKALSYYQPHVLLFVGVAGGLKDVQPGDVVAGRKIYFYESGRAEERFKIRPEIKEPTRLMEQRARVVARNNEWQQRIKGPSPSQLPKALLGIIAAGEKVVGSTESETWRLLHESYSDTQAVEMEGYGALLAAHTHTGIEAMVIRGISDTLDNKTELDKQNFQDIASRHASAFAFEMLEKLAITTGMAGSPSWEYPSYGESPGLNSPISHAIPANLQSTVAPNSPVRIFYSYMEDEKIDRGLIEDLKKQLATLRWNKQIEEWDVFQITAGTDRMATLRRYIEQAEIIVLGISSSYISSQRHYVVEMKGAMEERERRLVIVIPVLLRSTAGLESLPTKELLMLPRGMQNGIHKALTDSRNNREADLAEVAAEITTAIKQLRKS